MFRLKPIEKIKCMFYTIKDRGKKIQVCIDGKEFEAIIVSMPVSGLYYVMGQDSDTYCVAKKTHQFLYEIGRIKNYKDYVDCFKSINSTFGTEKDISECKIAWMNSISDECVALD